MSESELQEIRWKRMSMVFQSAMDALNPVISVGEQIIDTLMAHRSVTKSEARSRAGELFELVDILETDSRPTRTNSLEA